MHRRTLLLKFWTVGQKFWRLVKFVFIAITEENEVEEEDNLVFRRKGICLEALVCCFCLSVLLLADFLACKPEWPSSFNNHWKLMTFQICFLKPTCCSDVSSGYPTLHKWNMEISFEGSNVIWEIIPSGV